MEFQEPDMPIDVAWNAPVEQVVLTLGTTPDGLGLVVPPLSFCGFLIGAVFAYLWLAGWVKQALL